MRSVIKRYVAFSIVLAGTIFAFDLSLPLGVAGGMPYVALVLTGLWFPDKRAILVLGLVGTILTLAGYFLSEAAGIPWMVITNRLLAFAAIWVVAILAYQRKGQEQEIIEYEAGKKSEEAIRDAIESVKDGIVLYDADGHFVLCNEEFRKYREKMADLLVSDATIGSHIRAVVERGLVDLEGLTPEAWIARHDKHFENLNGPFEQKEPGDRTMLITPYRTQDGGTFIIRTDISDRKRAEQAARESEERTQEILDNLADGAITIDADGAIEYVNSQTERIFGYAKDELIGRNVSMLMPNPDRGSHDRYMSNYLKTGKARIIGIGREVTGLRKDGTTFPMDLAVSGTTVEERTIFTGTVRDMTERKKVERALIEAKLDAETASRVKTEFLANMSHELRTPLNAIIGFSDTMREKVFGPLANEKYEEYVDNIHESGEHLLDLINDILDVSMIEAGRLELNEEWIDVAKVIEASVRLVKSHAEQGDVRLALNLSDPLPGLFADERRVKQILLNLLSNAVKFTSEGGEVSLDAGLADDGMLVFTVADTGIGMAEDEIAEALEPFGQIDGSLSRKYEGTGLGLPVTKSLVEAHGGIIEIKSQPDKGTTVTVRFPENRVMIDSND